MKFQEDENRRANGLRETGVAAVVLESNDKDIVRLKGTNQHCKVNKKYLLLTLQGQKSEN